MKLDITKMVLTPDGEVYQSEEKKQINVKELIMSVLLYAPEKESEKEKISKEKLLRYELTLKVGKEKKEVDLLAEEIVLIKSLAYYLPVGLYGYLIYLLENKDTGIVEKETKKEIKK